MLYQSAVRHKSKNADRKVLVIMNRRFMLSAIALLIAALVCFSAVTVYASEEAGGEPKVIDKEIESVDDYIDNVGSSPVGDETDPETNGGEEVTYLAGDVDGNGKVNINDVTIYQLTLVEKIERTAAFEKNGDTYLDAQKTLRDATTIQIYLSGVYKKIPVTTDGYYAEIIRP